MPTPVGILTWIDARDIALRHSDVRVVEKPLHLNVLYHYLHKKNAHLIKPLNEALREMRKSGRIKEIQDMILQPAKQPEG